MVPIDLFDSRKSNLEYKLTKYVNDNLKIMIEVYIDYLDADDDFNVADKLMEVLPRDYVIRKTDECRRLVDELYEIICSPVVRDFIKPKYEYLLYNIIYRWKELCDDEVMPEYLPIKLDDELKAETYYCEDYLSEEDGHNIVIEILEDFDNYLNICFPDHDFLSESLEEMVEIYLRSPEIMESFFQDVNLDEYIDLMPVDLRELYCEKKYSKKLVKDEYSQNNDTERNVIIELYSALSLLQNHSVEWVCKSEVEISNDIYRMTKRVLKSLFNLEIEREAQIGRAKVNIGETDFAIYFNDRHYKNIAIIENKYIERFLDEYGQLLGYLNQSFKFGVTISINVGKTIGKAVDFIIEKLKSINDEDFKIVKIDRNPFGNEYNYIIKSEHTLPEDDTRTMSIYHLILNANDTARKRIAGESRKRGKTNV